MIDNIKITVLKDKLRLELLTIGNKIELEKRLQDVRDRDIVNIPRMKRK